MVTRIGALVPQGVSLILFLIVNPRHVHKKLYFVAKLYFVQCPA
jgi:hypothetical protein